MNTTQVKDLAEIFQRYNVTMLQCYNVVHTKLVPQIQYDVALI